MKNYLIFIIAIVCHLSLSNAQSQQCFTPDRRPGTCINIHQCPSILGIITKPNISPADRNYLQRSQCGYYGYVAVCCPFESNTQAPPNPQNPQNPQNNQNNQNNQNPQSGGLQASDLPIPGKCGVDLLGDRIVGGKETELLAYPWMVLIEYTKTNGKGFHCGGVLINKDYVLTAAHCVSGKDLLALRWTLSGVRLGEWDLNQSRDCLNDFCADPVLDVPVVERISHEQYISGSRAQENDIALLRLGRSVEFTDTVKPICLPLADNLRNRNYDGFTFVVAGWGKTENKSNSEIKLEVEVDGVPLSQCNEVYRNQNVQLSRNQLCAGGVKGKDSCRGDSGGPLMAKDRPTGRLPYHYLAGVVSFGPSPCGLENWPGVYTRIDSYIEWILAHMRP